MLTMKNVTETFNGVISIPLLYVYTHYTVYNRLWNLFLLEKLTLESHIIFVYFLTVNLWHYKWIVNDKIEKHSVYIHSIQTNVNNKAVVNM